VSPAALIAGLLIAGAPVDDEPLRRETAADLAYVLGEIHALGRLCPGFGAENWRARMEGLLQVEAADEAFRRRLMKRFNSGYLEASAAHPSCGPGGARAARRAQSEGAQLSSRLAQ
jgi:uncharacterized protein (TIGR02301 family)